MEWNPFSCIEERRNYLVQNLSMNIEKEIKSILSRNKKVEAEKAWETSWQRKVLVIAITYTFMIFFMNLIWVEWVFMNALIPTIWFFLSTLSLGLLKKKYIENYLSK